VVGLRELGIGLVALGCVESGAGVFGSWFGLRSGFRGGWALARRIRLQWGGKE